MAYVEWGTRLAGDNSKPRPGDRPPEAPRAHPHRRRRRRPAGAPPPARGRGRAPAVSTVNGAEPGPDGKLRCPWALGTPDYIDYHDSEWGRPLHGEAELFERLTLEAFQSGLSWLTILRKRENFRRAFDGFDIEKVAAYGANDTKRLLADARIVRNRKKIEAAITNAGA